MALDGLSYLSVDVPAVVGRPRSPRRSPRLRMNEEDEDEVDKERSSRNVGIRAPIIGYEVIDQRQKFTVFKIEVKSSQRSWFVFRRYTDFTRLNDRLKDAYPNFQIKLPGKRWFKDNFDAAFIEERARGLQLFINNVMNHAQISQSIEVQEFFCLSDPPGPYDSLEESRAYCHHLEDQVEDLKQKVEELTAELKITKSQLVQARVQQEALVSALRSERSLRKKKSTESSRNSADVEELMEKSENFANVDSLRGKFYHLLHSDQSSSKGEEDNISGNEREKDKTIWPGGVEIVEHSDGTNRIRPSQLVRRISQEAQNPRTSTPASSHSESSQPAFLDEENSAKKELEESDNSSEKTNDAKSASNIQLPEDQVTTEGTSHQEDLRGASRRKPKKRSSKRDSGISVDVSPTPST